MAVVSHEKLLQQSSVFVLIPENPWSIGHIAQAVTACGLCSCFSVPNEMRHWARLERLDLGAANVSQRARPRLCEHMIFFFLFFIRETMQPPLRALNMKSFVSAPDFRT